MVACRKINLLSYSTITLKILEKMKIVIRCLWLHFFCLFLTFFDHVYVGVCVLFLGFGFEVFFGSCVCVLHLHVMLSFFWVKAL